MGQSGIYLDHNATTPTHPDVLEAMREAQATAWANPASVHRPGQLARAELDRARMAVADLVGFHHRDVVLTSGGTEANNLALAQPFDGGRGGGLVLSRLEHPSVVQVALAHARRGVTVRWVEPDRAGVVRLEDMEREIAALHRDGGVVLVSLQAANHETGVLQPIMEVAALAHERGALLHVDAVQALGKIDGVDWSVADMLTLSAHKIRGPKGIGALLTRPGLRLQPLLWGGHQERGIRPGTLNPVLAAGLAEAARRAGRTPPIFAALAPLRDALDERLKEIGQRSDMVVLQNGEGARLPHVSNTSWPGWSSPELCAALDLEGVAVASGAACSAGSAEPSEVIMAMLGVERAASAVRVSLGEDTDAGQIDRALAAWGRVLEREPG